MRYRKLCGTIRIVPHCSSIVPLLVRKQVSDWRKSVFGRGYCSTIVPLLFHPMDFSTDCTPPAGLPERPPERPRGSTPEDHENSPPKDLSRAQDYMAHNFLYVNIKYLMRGCMESPNTAPTASPAPAWRVLIWYLIPQHVYVPQQVSAPLSLFNNSRCGYGESLYGT